MESSEDESTACILHTHKRTNTLTHSKQQRPLDGQLPSVKVEASVCPTSSSIKRRRLATVERFLLRHPNANNSSEAIWRERARNWSPKSTRQPSSRMSGRMIIVRYLFVAQWFKHSRMDSTRRASAIRERSRNHLRSGRHLVCIIARATCRRWSGGSSTGRADKNWFSRRRRLGKWSRRRRRARA